MVKWVLEAPNPVRCLLRAANTLRWVLVALSLVKWVQAEFSQATWVQQANLGSWDQQPLNMDKLFFKMECRVVRLQQQCHHLGK